MKHTDPNRWPLAPYATLCAGLLVSAMAVPAAAQMPAPASCGGLSNGNNGPFDYRSERPDLLKHGESFHFTAPVESLIRGQSGQYVGNDINFLLAMFPNHPRALVAMMRWGEKLKTSKPSDTPYSVECYFERALRFRPDDNVVRMIYALFLSKNARQTEAVKQLDLVSQLAGDNPFTHHNAGLLYFDLKEYDKALARAHVAAALGFSRPDLIDKLKGVGKWSDSFAAAASPTVPASAASAPF